MQIIIESQMTPINGRKCLLIAFLIIILKTDTNYGKNLPQNKMCGDSDCKVPIAFGKTTIPYKMPSNKYMVSFDNDMKVKIFGRTDDQKLLDIEVNGKRGLAPTSHIREEKVIIKNLEHAVKLDHTIDTPNDTTGPLNDSQNVVKTGSSVDTLVNDSAPQPSQVMLSQIHPSLSEESSDTIQTETPTADTKYTVIDGTSFLMDDMFMETSRTVNTEPMTATKSATIELNLDNNNTEVKQIHDINTSITENHTVDTQASDTIKSNDSSKSALNLTQLSPTDGLDKSVKQNETTNALNESDITNTDNKKSDNISSELKMSDNTVNVSDPVLPPVEPTIDDITKPDVNSLDNTKDIVTNEWPKNSLNETPPNSSDSVVENDSNNSKQLNDETSDKTPEELTEKPTKEVTEKFTEKVIEKSEELIEKSTEEVTEKSTEELIEKSTEKVTEKSTEELIEKSTEKVTEKSTEELIEKSSEELKDKPNDNLNKISDDINTNKKDLVENNESTEPKLTDNSSNVLKESSETIRVQLNTSNKVLTDEVLNNSNEKIEEKSHETEVLSDSDITAEKSDKTMHLVETDNDLNKNIVNKSTLEVNKTDVNLTNSVDNNETVVNEINKTSETVEEPTVEDNEKIVNLNKTNDGLNKTLEKLNKTIEDTKDTIDNIDKTNDLLANKTENIDNNTNLSANSENNKETNVKVEKSDKSSDDLKETNENIDTITNDIQTKSNEEVNEVIENKSQNVKIESVISENVTQELAKDEQNISLDNKSVETTSEVLNTEKDKLNESQVKPNSDLNEPTIETNNEFKENTENIDSKLSEDLVDNSLLVNSISIDSNDILKDEQIISEKNITTEDQVFGHEVDYENAFNIDNETDSNALFKWLGLDGMAINDVISDIIPDDIEIILKQYNISAKVIVFTFIVGFNWCLMKIFISLFNSHTKERDLRDLVCRYERQIYYFEAEKQKLQSNFLNERENTQRAEERLHKCEYKVIPLESECLQYQAEREQLYQRISSLESELENAAEAGLEANRLLNDFLISQKENVSLNSIVDSLQHQITRQTEMVSNYESIAKQKQREVSELKDKNEKMSSELKRIRNMLKETEHNLQTVQKNNEELKSSKSELNSSLALLEEQDSSLQLKTNDLIKTNDELLNDIQNVRQEMYGLREQSAKKDLEIESLRDVLSKLEDNSVLGGDQTDCNVLSGKSTNNFYNIVEMDLKLKNSCIEKNELNSKLEETIKKCEQLNSKLNALEMDNKSLKSDCDEAMRDRLKAQTELEVLTKYYKQKEIELGKEIGVQHIHRQLREEDSNSLTTRMETIEDENISLRSQLQSMKREVTETESKYKKQITLLEKQVHENWILSRTAQRALDESKAEASALRQTLTMSVKSSSDGFGGDSFMDDSASSVSSLPDHYGHILPPIPPPPPIFNPLMPPMHMPYQNGPESMQYWNNNQMHHSFPQMAPNFAPIQANGANNGNVSFESMSMNSQHNMGYVPHIQQQWDSASNRDCYSPAISQRSTNSPLPSQPYMYSQPNDQYSNTMDSTMNSTINSMSSPMINSSMNYSQSSVQSANMMPEVNHWVQPNGNISNLNYSHNLNESEESSRSVSRNDNPLQSSIV